MSMLYKLQDKNFLEEELNVLHGSKISSDGVLETSMRAEHHDRECRERCCLSYSRQEAEKEKGAILIKHSKAHPYHLPSAGSSLLLAASITSLNDTTSCGPSQRGKFTSTS